MKEYSLHLQSQMLIQMTSNLFIWHMFNVFTLHCKGTEKLDLLRGEIEKSGFFLLSRQYIYIKTPL